MARILVIDDDAQMRNMLRQMLESEGHTAAVAENGKEGLLQMRTHPFDLVITDLIMPEKEGIETIQELRKSYPDLKIIAISGGGRYGQLEYLPVAKKLGADSTLAKPFRKQELLEMMEDVLNLSQAHQA